MGVSPLPGLGFAAHGRLVYDVTPMAIRANGAGVELVWDAEHGRPGFSPTYVSFINPAPAVLREYTEFFGCPVEFEQVDTVIRLGAQTLLEPLQTADPAMLAMLEEQADALLACLPDQSPLNRRLIGSGMLIGLFRAWAAELGSSGLDAHVPVI